MKNVLVLDVGTTAIKSFVFQDEKILGQASVALTKICRAPNIVEQNPSELLRATRKTMRAAVRASKIKITEISAIGLSNQRESVVAWDKTTGKTLTPLIVWQDERAKNFCRSLAREHDALVRSLTGLPLIPYFSAGKIAWILKNVPATTKLAEQNRLAVGTIDSWLMFNLLSGKPFLTDYTNASRTLLFNIKNLVWDERLLKIFGVPKNILAAAQPSRHHFGVLRAAILGRALPLNAVCGDQQASLFAAGAAAGTTEITFGTGAFLLQNLGKKLARTEKIFTTLAAESKNDSPRFALEIKFSAHCGAEVAASLTSPKKLTAALNKLSLAAAKTLAQLPLTPKILQIGGGITRDHLIVAPLQKTTGLKIKTAALWQTTALGIAKLLR